MSWLTLCLVMVALPIVALVYQRVADTGMAERHHRHHDTYVVPVMLTRTLSVVMLFMAVLGAALTWLCSLGAFTASPLVVLSFFLSFVATTFCLWFVMRHYSVVTYRDYMVITPFAGRKRTIRYRDIERMEWTRSIIGSRQNVRVYVRGQKRGSTIWGTLDVQQILMGVNRFDVLAASPGADRPEAGR